VVLLTDSREGKKKTSIISTISTS